MSGNLGEKIKYYRKLKGYSQENLADKTSLSKMSIRRYESGERQPGLDALKKIAAALDCQVSDIDESLSINRKIPYFADVLKKLRLEHGLTQKELAKKLHIKEKNISNWENGEREPYYNTLKKIAEYFGTSLLYFYDGKANHKIIDINDTDAIAREKAIESAPRFVSKNEIDYPLPYRPPKFTDRSTRIREEEIAEQISDFLRSMFDEESPLNEDELEKIATQLNEILTSYSKLNEIGRYTATETIKELNYSSTLTEAKLDNIRYNRIQKKINNGENLTQEEIEFEHTYLEKPLKKLGVIFENYYFMLNKEGQKFAKESINQAIEQLIYLTKIPSCRKPLDEPPQE